MRDVCNLGQLVWPRWELLVVPPAWVGVAAGYLSKVSGCAFAVLNSVTS